MRAHKIDNLKTGVIKPDLYDPKLNRAYAEMAEHYGCLIDPARAEETRDYPEDSVIPSRGCQGLPPAVIGRESSG